MIPAYVLNDAGKKLITLFLITGISLPKECIYEDIVCIKMGYFQTYLPITRKQVVGSLLKSMWSIKQGAVYFIFIKRDINRSSYWS